MYNVKKKTPEKTTEFLEVEGNIMCAKSMKIQPQRSNQLQLLSNPTNS